jgi:hypothetical protein
MIWIATIEPSTVASDSIGNYIGNLLWGLFYDFLDLFLIHREQTPYRDSAVNALTTNSL